jgi:hypothetical protein
VWGAELLLPGNWRRTPANWNPRGEYRVGGSVGNGNGNGI